MASQDGQRRMPRVGRLEIFASGANPIGHVADVRSEARPVDPFFQLGLSERAGRGRQSAKRQRRDCFLARGDFTGAPQSSERIRAPAGCRPAPALRMARRNKGTLSVSSFCLARRRQIKRNC
jgi:hypothetical protein